MSSGEQSLLRTIRKRPINLQLFEFPLFHVVNTSSETS